MASAVTDSEWILLHDKSSPVFCSGVICKQADFYSFVWVRLQTPSLCWSPVPGVVAFPRAVAQCEWEVFSLTLCKKVNYLGQSLTTSSHKESASTTNDPGCFSSVSSSWSGSLFRIISIPRVFMNESLWQFPALCYPLRFVCSQTLTKQVISGWIERSPVSWVGKDRHMHRVLLKSHFPHPCCFAIHSGVSGIMFYRDRKCFINAKSKPTAITRK